MLDAETRFDAERYWPVHVLDRQAGATKQFETSLYDGACGVFWALHYLEAVGAATLSRSYAAEWDRLLPRHGADLDESVDRRRASFLLGDTPIHLMSFGVDETEERESALHALIAGNVEHPARELMLGSPGTMLAALFVYERTGNRRWSDLFRVAAGKLRTQLEWSARHRCSYWTQRAFGWQTTYLGAVHGFVGAAFPLIRGRHLLGPDEWSAWEGCIVDTVQRTADRAGPHANWRPLLDSTEVTQKKLVQLCHGAPGFVVCLAGLPSAGLDDLLLAAGETIWTAGPLPKGSNLCHGTGGNGYALLKLYQRTRDSRWLDRARSFAMHGIAQTEEDASRHGQMRYSLWTGDIGFAIYLWDCVRANAQFPTLDVFYPPSPSVIQ